VFKGLTFTCLMKPSTVEFAKNIKKCILEFIFYELKIRNKTCYPTHFLLGSKLISWRFNNRSSEFKKTLFAAFDMVCAISLAASIFLSVINAGLLAIACPISWALFASPCSLKVRNEGQEELNTYEAKSDPIRTTVNSILYILNLNSLKLNRQIYERIIWYQEDLIRIMAI